MTGASGRSHGRMTNTMELPTHLVETIVNQADMPIDTRMALRKTLHIARRPVVVPVGLREKLEAVHKRRDINYRKFASTSREEFRWSYLLDALPPHRVRPDKYVEISIMEVEGDTVEFTMRITGFDADMHLFIREDACDINTGRPVPLF